MRVENTGAGHADRRRSLLGGDDPRVRRQKRVQPESSRVGRTLSTEPSASMA